MSLGRIVLAPPERRELKRRARKRSLAAELVKRAEVILMLAAGQSYREIRQRLDCSDEYVREWKRRFQEDRLAGLDWFRLTNHIVGGVGVGPGFDGWLFPGEPRRRREFVNPICWEVLQAREYDAEIFAHRNLQS